MSNLEEYVNLKIDLINYFFTSNKLNKDSFKNFYLWLNKNFKFNSNNLFEIEFDKAFQYCSNRHIKKELIQSSIKKRRQFKELESERTKWN